MITKTDFLKITVQNPNFDLIHVVSKIKIADLGRIDNTRLIEKEAKKEFFEYFKTKLDLEKKIMHWYTQFHPKTFEALVIVMKK